MARFACVVLTLWNLTMRDRVSDPVSRPKGPRARCGQSTSIAAVYLAIKKLIPLLFVTFTTDRRWQLPQQPETLFSTAA